MTIREGPDAQGVEQSVRDVDYPAVFAQAPAPFLLLTPDLVIVDASAAYLAATATTLAGVVGRPLFEVFPVPDDPAADGRDNLTAALERARDTRRPVTMPVQRYDLRRPDGSFEERHWSPHNVPVLDEHGEVLLLLHRADDITDYVRARDAVRVEAERGLQWRERVQQVEGDLFARAQQLSSVNQQLQELNEQLRLTRDELTVRALHDPLTGLLVRPVLLEQLAHALSRLRRHPGDVAVLFVDLDGLKRVNDTHGHAAGDVLVRACAQHLRDAVRPSDTVARIGGDEFVVLLEDLEQGCGQARAQEVAQRLLQRLGTICTLAPGVVVRPSASIGIAVAQGPGAGGPAEVGAALTADEVLSRADSAMYDAKRRGRGRCEVFDEAAHRQRSARRRLEVDLRAALPEGRLRLHYQPIIDLRSGATVAVEALLRWQHPDGQLRVAGEFVEVAEQIGLLGEFGAWVRSEACRQLAAWDAELGTRAPAQVFLNLSPAELTQPRLPGQLAEATRAAGVAPDRLVLEVTETGMMDAVEGRVALDALQRLGCRLAIDDFGTGWSSLSRLVHLPVSVLKVDRSFLRDLHRDQQSVAVIAAVLTLAHNLRKTVIAEGVEDAASLRTLEDLGCSHAQGHHLSEPRPPDQLAAHLLGLPGTGVAEGPARPLAVSRRR